MNLFYFFIGFLVQVSVAQCTDRASKAIPGASITYKKPNQVGFSYDEIVAGVFDALGGLAGSGEVIPGGVGSNLTNIQGRFASQNPATTAKTSKMAAKSMWYFLQVFFAE
ncbi:hypothetical protein PMIN05_011299 [Paraphaeosphaeria minitans]